MNSLRRLYEIGCPACDSTLEGDTMIDIGCVDSSEPGLMSMVGLHSREIRARCSGPDWHECTVHFGSGQMWTTVRQRGEPDATSAFEALVREARARVLEARR